MLQFWNKSYKMNLLRNFLERLYSLLQRKIHGNVIFLLSLDSADEEVVLGTTAAIL